eukprot:GILI01029832.1.p1 GENE.GILI01029832.1~~GILI01029832.1.p1  ORF type:complete len:189 (-),score=25.01 GILI01029832.1:74-559(-)
MAAAKNAVKFNDLHDIPYGVFSPLSPHPVTIRHRAYPSVNHYFQAQRFANSASYERICAAPSLWELDRLVRKAEEAHHQAPEWDNIKTDVMLLGNYYKFKQNADARAVLAQTSNKVVVYHTADTFWGDGNDGTSGKNLLGVVLMAVRKRIAAEEAPKKPKA